jgi:serine protease Do
MAQQFQRSVWYDQTLPTAPMPYAANGAAPGQKKKNRGLKVLLIILFALILAVAVTYAATDGFNFDFAFPQPRITFPDSTLPRTEPHEPDGNEEGDFRSYFRSFTSATERRSGSDLERAEVADAPELTLQSAGDREELSLQQLYSRCADSVVGIKASTDGSLGYAWGTGIVMTMDGYILTNEHVIDGTDSAVVVLSDGSEYPALLVGEDVQTDIALLKIDAPPLHAAEFGDSSEMQVGDPVAAIGNPLSDTFTNSLTNGIISAINRDVSVNGRKMTLLQTNAALNEGNSGGPLLNMYGQVVGITNMKMVNNYSDVTVEGIGFAIPTTTVKSVVDQLIAKGRVTGRPGLGITVTAVSEAVSRRYEIPCGLFVDSVVPGSDAEAQGVRPDDIITAANGQEILTTDDLLQIRDSLSVGDHLSLTLWREGETLEITIRVMDQNELNQ